MDRKIRVGAVSYLNTKPLIYGFEQGMMKDQIDLRYDYPAQVAKDLLAGDIDLGLVPVAIIPLLSEAHIISAYGIAADGPVASVSIFAEKPLADIQNLLLDYQSRTSVQLAKILLRDYWKLQPNLEPATDDAYTKRIQGATAGLVIGDRAFLQRQISPFQYDLAAAWKAHTGKPFVFAAWVSNKPLSADFIAAFDAANRFGLDHIEAVIAANPYPHYDLHAYYTQNIQYELHADKKAGLTEFLALLGTL